MVAAPARPGALSLMAAAALFLVSCRSDPTASRVPTTISIQPTAVTLDAVGATQQLQVVIRDQNGAAMEDVAVTWTAQGTGTASVSPQGIVTSHSNGSASITAKAGGLQTSATVTVEQIVQSLSKTDGDAQQATVGSQLPLPIQVVARDRMNNPVPGVSVYFAVGPNGGSTSNTSATTNSNGEAGVTWTVGTTPGNYTLRATVASLAPVDFAASAVARPPTFVQVHDGNNQSAAIGSAVAIPPAVRVTDEFFNPLEGVPVAFSVTTGGGSTTGANTVTDATGVARLGSWTLGVTPGANQLSASVAALEPLFFNATAMAVPASIVIFQGNNQTATVGTAVTVSPAVRITTAEGLPIPGLPVTYTVLSGGGAGTGSPAITNAAGIATLTTWTLGTAAGANTLRATLAGLPPVDFTANAVAGAPATIVGIAGNNQTATAGTPVPIAPAVLVRDVFANPVSGVTVSFAITAGAGSLTGASPATNATGVASVGSWIIALGINTLEATAVGAGIAGNPVQFSATGVAASAFDIELRYLSGVTQSQQAAFNSAIARWQAIITGDLPNVTVNLPAGDCGSASPAMSETIDDLVIFVTLTPIDGAGGILGSAGWCRVRGGSLLPVTGQMRFDTADLAVMEAGGILEDVILHEMGHVLGLEKNLWTFKGLLVNPSLPSSPGADTHFNGLNAIAAFNSVGGTSYAGGAKVPVENTQGGSGTRDSHWREGVFDNELMTGFVSNPGPNPLSVVTIAALQDMGYTVNPAAADIYELPGGAALSPGSRVHLGDDVIVGPLRTVGPPGGS